MINKNTNRALQLLSVHHKEFISVAKSLYGNDARVRNYAEDYVQEAYLKLSRYDDLYDKIITKKGVASKGYMFFALRSIILNDFKKVKAIKYNFLGDQYDIEEKYMLVENPLDPYVEAVQKMENKVYDVLKGRIDWFDFELFKTYIKSGKSFRTIAKETGLGIQTIYLSVKKSKAIISEELDEDYQDLLNGDYSKIN
tara:strand:+ start:278 stop:868 length:591 start_codon:yes stop_codon:yes gene_type:complete